jgi:signal peptidase II
MGRAGLNYRHRAALLIAAIFILDRVTKMYIRAHVGPFDMIPVIPGVLNIVWTENPGAAFSMFADSAPFLRGFLLIGISFAVMSVVGWMLWRPPSPTAVENALMRVALALVFGGALGNLWDRVLRGTVTDFIQVFIGSYEFPSFNVADSAISIGAGLLILDLWRSGKRA